MLNTFLNTQMRIAKIAPLTFIAMSLGAAFIVFLAIPHAPRVKPAVINTHSSIGPYFEDFDFTFYRDNGAVKVYTIHGKTLGSASKKIGLFKIGAVRELLIRDVDVTFYEKNMPISTLRARKARMDIPSDRKNAGVSLSGIMEFSGDVSIITGDRRTLTCRNIRWDNSAKSVFASGDCVLRYEGKAVKADIINTDAGLKDFSYGRDRNKRLRALTKLL